jgi:hypothetical protein
MKIDLTPAEIEAALNAISQMTNGNARDFSEWKLATHSTRAEWNALLRAEEKLEAARRKRAA